MTARSCATLRSAYVREAITGSVRYLMTRSRAIAFHLTLAAGSNVGRSLGPVLSEQAASVERRVKTSGAGVRRDRTEQRCTMRRRPCDGESRGPYRVDAGGRKSPARVTAPWPRGVEPGWPVASGRRLFCWQGRGAFLPRSDIARPHHHDASPARHSERGMTSHLAAFGNEHVHAHERPRLGLDRPPRPRRAARFPDDPADARARDRRHRVARDRHRRERRDLLVDPGARDQADPGGGGRVELPSRRAAHREPVPTRARRGSSTTISASGCRRSTTCWRTNGPVDDRRDRANDSRRSACWSRATTSRRSGSIRR